MNEIMKPRYRIYRRQGGMFYLFDRHNGKRESLQTTDKPTALRLLQAKNEAQREPAINLQIAKAYLAAFDPQMARRTWRDVMQEIPKLKKGNTRVRWLTAIRDKAFSSICELPLLETRAEHFLAVLECGAVSTNSYLRRIHRFALDMNWLPWRVLPNHRWQALKFKEKRAITWEEHQRILGGENNSEWRAFYEMLWHLGGSQTDMAMLRAEDINWADRTIAYARRKTGTVSVIHFGPSAAEILRFRPQSGFLFPMIARWKEADRGKAFIRRCRLVGVAGVSLHSYRYAWAERARQCGYRRFYRPGRRAGRSVWSGTREIGPADRCRGRGSRHP